MLHLHNLPRIKHYLTLEATERAMRAFVFTILDVGNILLHRLPQNLMQRSQSVRHSALVDGAKKFCQVTSHLTKCELEILIPTHHALTERYMEIILRVDRRHPPRADGRGNATELHECKAALV